MFSTSHNWFYLPSQEALLESADSINYFFWRVRIKLKSGEQFLRVYKVLKGLYKKVSEVLYKKVSEVLFLKRMKKQRVMTFFQLSEKVLSMRSETNFSTRLKYSTASVYGLGDL